MWEPTRGTTLNKHLLTTAAKLASWQIAKNYAGNHMFYVLAHSASKPWKFKTSKWTTKKTTLTLGGLKTRATTAGTRMISITSMSFWGEGRWTYSPHLSEPSPDGYKLWSHLQVQWLGLRSALHLEQLKTTPLALPAEPTALLVSRAVPLAAPSQGRRSHTRQCTEAYKQLFIVLSPQPQRNLTSQTSLS